MKNPLTRVTVKKLEKDKKLKWLDYERIFKNKIEDNTL